MPTFELIHGCHVEGKTIYKQGSIFESKSDLVKKFNSRGSEKFRLVRTAADPVAVETTPPVPSQETEEEETEEVISSENGQPISQEDLETMDVDQLRELCEDEEIDLGRTTKKDSIIKKILDHFDA